MSMNFEDFEDFEDLEDDIPDTIEELLEEWQRADDVKAATASKAEALAEQEAAKIELAEINSAESEINAQIVALQNKALTLRRKQMETRGRLNSRDRVIERADQVISVARINFENEKAESDKLIDLRNVGKFAWNTGVVLGEKTLHILPHQELAGEVIGLYKKIILADDMGVGKTLSMIASMDYAKADKILIICPADVTSNFLDEIEMWAPHRIVINIRGLSKSERNAALGILSFVKQYTVITNYESWRKDHSLIETLIKLNFNMMFMDEAHVMKDMATSAFRGVKEIAAALNTCDNCNKVTYYETSQKCQHCGGYDRRASVEYIVPATGTPILNGPEDMYSLLNLIDEQNFYQKNTFLRNFAQMDQYSGKWTFKDGGEASLLKRLGRRFLRRTMNDVGIELPPLQVIMHSLNFEAFPLQDEVYQEITKYGEIFAGHDINGDPKKVSTAAIIAQITRQRQVTVWPAGITIKDSQGNVLVSVSERINESVKVDKAMELIEEAWMRGERVAVFSQFQTGLIELERRLAETPMSAVRFDGSTKQSTRIEVKRNFDASRGQEAKWDVLLANYKSGGVGLNLTECTTMVMLDVEWNPGKENQAMKRIQRIGQEKNTFVHILEVENTVDTWMRRLIKGKQAIIEGFEVEQATLQEEYLSALKKGEI